MVEKNDDGSDNSTREGNPIWRILERNISLATLRLLLVTNSFIHKRIVRIKPEGETKFLDKVDLVC